MNSLRVNSRRTLVWFLVAVLLMGMVTIPAAAFGKSAKITVTGSKYVAKGKKVTLTADQDVTWKTSDKKIATVSSKGEVKGKKAGKVTITAVSKKDKSVKKKWEMTVTKNAAKSVKIKASTQELDLNNQKTVKLKATVSPSDAAQDVTWKSSNTSVAKVDSKGKVTAVAAGKAKITATAVDGSKKKASVTITVSGGFGNVKVGVSMPTKDLQRWVMDGTNMENQLQKAGFQTELMFASNDVPTQKAQVEAMIENGCSIIVVAAISGTSLNDVLAKAKEKGIKVIAYDRLLMDTDAISFYVTFSSKDVGKQQGKYIRDALKLSSAEGPFHLEITAGDPIDGNAKMFYDGAMSVLKPYIESGKLIVKSGKTDFYAVSTEFWSSSTAEARASGIINTYYTDGTTLDAWLCSNDTTAKGVIQALTTSGYKGKWPVITGQDCDKENVKLIIQGKQSMSVYKKSLNLVKVAVSAVEAFAKGKSPSSSTKTNNNKIQVPTGYGSLVNITKSNYKILIEDGFYSASDFN